MVRLIIVWLCLQFLVFPLKAQEGFIQAYDLDGAWVTFQRMLLVEDTLIIIGTKQINNEPSAALFFCKMDTMGNILDYKTHYDSLVNTYDFFEHTEIIKTNDGGYAMVGRIYPINTTSFVKLEVNGNLEFGRQYIDIGAHIIKALLNKHIYLLSYYCIITIPSLKAIKYSLTSNK